MTRIASAATQLSASCGRAPRRMEEGIELPARAGAGRTSPAAYSYLSDEFRLVTRRYEVQGAALQAILDTEGAAR